MNEWPTAAMFELMNEWRVRLRVAASLKVLMNEREGAGQVWPCCTIQPNRSDTTVYSSGQQAKKLSNE